MSSWAIPITIGGCFSTVAKSESRVKYVSRLYSDPPESNRSGSLIVPKSPITRFVLIRNDDSRNIGSNSTVRVTGSLPPRPHPISSPFAYISMFALVNSCVASPSFLMFLFFSSVNFSVLSVSRLLRLIPSLLRLGPPPALLSSSWPSPRPNFKSDFSFSTHGN